MDTRITKDYINHHKFINDGVSFEIIKEDADYRFAPGTVLPSTAEEKEIKLRKKLSEIVYGPSLDGNFTKIEALTSVGTDTIRKFLNARQKGRSFTRANLAKFCVGLKLPLDVTKELFLLQGFSLDVENNRLDAIVVNCLQDQEDIYTFLDMCHQYNVNLERKTTHI